MKLRTAAAALTILAQAAWPGPAAWAREPAEATKTSLPADVLRVVDAWLESERAFQRIPAMSATITQGDDMVFAAGYGTVDAARKTPAASDTLYSICSISKLFTSVALMQQWEAGKVRLDEPLTSYLPWAKLKPLDEDSVPITLRGALTHSAGLPRDFDKPYWSGPDFTFPTEEEVKTGLAKQQPLWPASRYFQYSNVGLTLVGDTVAAVSGQPYADYVKANVLAPLGLKDTYVGLPMALYGQRLAVGWGSPDRQGQIKPLPPFDTRGVLPAAGLVSSAEDLSRFARWQFRLLRTGKTEVLKASTLREMQRVQFLDPNWKDSWGLGFHVWKKGEATYVGHDGACPGYKTNLSLRPATETAVVVMMAGMGDAWGHSGAIFDLLDRRKAAPTSGPSLPDAELEAYSGVYSGQPWISEIAVAPWSGGLALMSLPSANPAEGLDILRPEGKDTFRRLREDGSKADLVRFERDASGKVTGFTEFSMPHPRLAALPAADHAKPKPVAPAT